MVVSFSFFQKFLEKLILFFSFCGFTVYSFFQRPSLNSRKANWPASGFFWGNMERNIPMAAQTRASNNLQPLTTLEDLDVVIYWPLFVWPYFPILFSPRGYSVIFCRSLTAPSTMSNVNINGNFLVELLFCFNSFFALRTQKNSFLYNEKHFVQDLTYKSGRCC